jgi:hypothetical protein
MGLLRIVRTCDDTGSASLKAGWQKVGGNFLLFLKGRPTGSKKGRQERSNLPFVRFSLYDINGTLTKN